MPRPPSVIIACFLAVFLAGAATDSSNGHNNNNECVVLLHGLARSDMSMNRLDKHLHKAGYATINVDYPSTSDTIEHIVERYVSPAVKKCQTSKAKKVHFVTHSLGGILVRKYLQSHTVPAGSRMVMIAPPNQGSEITDALKDFFVYQWAMGPAGQELGTDQKSVPNQLKPVNIDIGIIAGDSSLNPIFSSIIPGPDDGKVSVERTKLSQMKDFIIVRSTHTLIMNKAAVLDQVAHFLQHGTFDHTWREKEEPLADY